MSTSSTSKFLIAAALLVGLSGLSHSDARRLDARLPLRHRLDAETADAPFPVSKGISVAGPFVRVRPVTSSPDGQVSDFWTLQLYPNWYTGDDLRKVGFDFIRLPVNPAVLLENPPAVRERLLDEVENAMQTYLSSGVHVVYDLHFWSPPNKVWTANAVISGDPSIFVAYRALVQKVAARLARFPHRTVALELFNEPPATNCDTTGWISKQRELLKDVRKVAAILPVVVEGCAGQLDGLLALNGSNLDIKDNNLVFSFHFYEPFIFTHQGGYTEYRNIEGLRYPGSAGNLMAAIDATSHNIDAAGLSAMTRAGEKVHDVGLITKYFTLTPNNIWQIKKRFNMLMAWAQANGIPSSRILMGEFAAINWHKTDTADYLASRIRWDNDVIDAATSRGVAWTYWNLPYPKGPILR